MAVKKTTKEQYPNIWPSTLAAIVKERKEWKKHPKTKQVRYTFYFTDDRPETLNLVMRVFGYAGVAEYPHKFYFGVVRCKNNTVEYEASFRAPSKLGAAIVNALAVYRFNVYTNEDTAANWERAQEYEISAL